MDVSETVPNRFGTDTRHDFHVLKDGDLFVVFPASGDINARSASQGEALSKDGLFFRDTRYLSRLSLSINGTSLIEMGHDARDDNVGFSTDLANKSFIDNAGTQFRDFEMHVRRDRILSDGLFDRIAITNFGSTAAQLDVMIECWADYRDIFEVRGAKPTERGEMLPIQFEDGTIRFAYVTADGRRLETRVRIDPAPAFDSGRAHIHLDLASKARTFITCTVEVWESNSDPTQGEVNQDEAEQIVRARGEFDGDTDQRRPAFEVAQRAFSMRLARRLGRTSGITTSRPTFNAWLARSSADLAILTSDLATGPYPYAGIPWFSVPFGRDGLITALQTIWLNAELSAGVLDFLAATQAKTLDAFQDAEPGKILHEHRNGELARSNVVPFHHYYGGVDQTLLFVMLAQAYWRRTADAARLKKLAPAICAALAWAKDYGDSDGDGFIDYKRSAETGLRNQGWKDSEDSIFHADGSLCKSPVALIEVQGYHVAALRAAAEIFEAIGDPDEAPGLRRRADELVQKIDEAYWDDELGTYCIALDADGRRVRVSASNAGHLPFSGAVLPERLDRLFETLSSSALLSGWGVRTVATGAARFNPMGYHNGSVWPHDNSLIAAGAARAGRNGFAQQITSELFDASCHFPENRLPELWCGIPRAETARPVAFPSACAPQAWAAGAVFLCLQSCLGLSIDAPSNRIRIAGARLPSELDWLEVSGLNVGGRCADLFFARGSGDEAEVEVRHADPGLEVQIGMPSLAQT